MVQPALTALALIFILGHEAVPAALSTLQAESLAEQEDAALPTVAESPKAQTDKSDEAIILTSEPTETGIPVLEPSIPETQIDTPDVDPLIIPAIETGGAEISTDTPRSPPEATLVQGTAEVVPVTPATTITRHQADTPSYKITLERAQLALSSAKTAKGRFTQTNADGSLYEGAFAISRPGKLRFEYDAPVPVLIVSDGTTVAMEDRDLETIDRVPLGSTPLGLILNDRLEFTDDVIVTEVTETTRAFEITVEDASGEMPGTLTMHFNKAENALIGWHAVDAELNSTIVALQDVETNKRINPRQFILRDAEDEEDDR